MRNIGRGLAVGFSLFVVAVHADARLAQVGDSSNSLKTWTETTDGHQLMAQTTPEAAPAPAAPSATTPAAPDAASPATPPVDAAEPAPSPPDPASPDTAAPATPDGGQVDDQSVLPDLTPAPEGDDFSVGEIPAVETIELTEDTARKALDAYILVRDKYKDAELENYESLQDFVDQNAQGKAFEADIKSFGFGDVATWNTTIASIGFAYSMVLDDQTADIRQQIEEVKQDGEMAQDMRDRMVKALEAMIPSPNNKTVLEALVKDPVYSEKLKQLETEEE